jgi:hypothetical protein
MNNTLNPNFTLGSYMENSAKSLFYSVLFNKLRTQNTSPKGTPILPYKFRLKMGKFEFR